MTAEAAATMSSCRRAVRTALRPEPRPRAAPTASEATAVTTAGATTAAAPSVTNRGTSGTRAPSAKSSSEPAAATAGEPASSAPTPNRMRRLVCRAVRPAETTPRVARTAVTGSRPRSRRLRARWAITTGGECRQASCSESSVPRATSRWPRTDTHSQAAVDSAPATGPASPDSRTVAASTEAPAMPRMKQRLLTSPSLTPRTAARIPPPATRPAVRPIAASSASAASSSWSVRAAGSRPGAMVARSGPGADMRPA